MNPLWILASLFGFLFDRETQAVRNREAAGREDELQRNVEEGQAEVVQAATTMPSFYYGGSLYRPPGAPETGGPRPINLEDAFSSGENTLAAFDRERRGLDTEVSPLGLDFSGLGGVVQGGLDRTRSDLSGIIQRATLVPGSLVKGVDVPDTDLSAVLASDIAGQGTASKGRVEAGRISLASAAPFLGGLEGVERENRSLDFSEGAVRAGQAVQSTANVRAQEADLEKFKAELQGTLGMKEADINALLAQAEAVGATQLGLRGSQVPLEAGDLNLRTRMGERAIEEGNIGRALDLFLKRLGLVGISGQEDTAKLMTALDLLLKHSGAVQGAAATNLSADLGYGNLLAGSGLLGRDDVSMQNMINNLMTAWVNSQQPSSEGGGFSADLGSLFGGGVAALLAGGGSGAATGLGAAGSLGKMLVMCIDGSASLETLEGKQSLADVEVGEQVRGGDGLFHVVKAKDYGVPHTQRWNDYVRIEQEGRTLICTRDHVIDGIPAGDWEEAEACNAVPSGDVALVGCTTYIANGFVITSILKG